jgi:hypothetical protein
VATEAFGPEKGSDGLEINLLGTLRGLAKQPRKENQGREQRMVSDPGHRNSIP